MKTSRFVLRNLLGELIRFALIGLVCTGIAALGVYSVVAREFKSKGVTIAQSLSKTTIDSVIDTDGAAIQANINRYRDILGVSYVAVLDQQGEIISHTFAPKVPRAFLHHVDRVYQMANLQKVQEIELEDQKGIIDISEPVLGGVAGYVHVGMDKSIIITDTIYWTKYILLAVMGLFVVSAGVSWLSAHRISRPLLELTDYASRVARLDFSVQDLHIKTGDELETLADGMLKMKAELQQAVGGLEQTISDILAIDNMEDGLVMTDTNGVITRCNPSFALMCDRTTKSLLRLSFEEVISCDIIPELRKLSCVGEGVTREVALNNHKIVKIVGKAILTDPTAVPNRQNVVGYVISLCDITRDKELEQLKTAFIGTVSHELRTPLTAILGFAALVKGHLDNTIIPAFKETDGKVKRALDVSSKNINIIAAEGQRLTTIVNDLLDVMKIESGEMQWEISHVDLNAAVEQAIQSTSPLFFDSEVNLQFIPDTSLPEVEGDYNRLVQITINLISNAFKFTDKGSVTCRTFQTEQHVCLSIADTGIGISRADQDKIFQRFKQLGNQLTGKPAGSGLGLAICKEIAQHLGGDVTVESEVGKGSTFTVHIPKSTS